MGLRSGLKYLIKHYKKGSLWFAGGIFITYHISQTVRSINKIVNPSVMVIDQKHVAEYIYIDDPSYGITLKLEQDKENRRSLGLARIWKSLKHSLASRLLWLCRHGNKEQRNIALEQLASLKNNKSWDYLKLAQALDKNTAVLLARTAGADLRYFLPPPIYIRQAALSPELISYKFGDMLAAAQKINPHSCIQHFLTKYFANVLEQPTEADSVTPKPDSISEHDLCILCLDAIHHHISLFNNKLYEEDISCNKFIELGLLSRLAELLLRNSNSTDIDLGVLRVLTVLSVHHNLLTDFFQTGLIGELSRLLRSTDVRLSSSAAVCLANLSGEYCYRPGLYLLYPLYRTRTPHTCDLLLVHGLRGGVFVTWRQRDKKCAEPIGIVEVTVAEVDCDPCEEKVKEVPYMDPDLEQVIEDIKEFEDESLLSDFDVILHDIPIYAKREPNSTQFSAKNKRTGLIEEDDDRCNYTYCWPKDWLPKDCSNLRILGVNYWSSLSEWLERCPMQTADIETRAAELAPNFIDAGVGKKNIPVVWLAHSMGGLIVKQLLADAAKNEDIVYKNVCENTKAILFYSTPHKGSALATMPRAAAAVLWPSNDVRQLQENSPVLLELHNAFIKYADAYGWETISFAETMPTLVTAFKVPVHFVEANSADLGRGVFYQLPLDHLSICKPATRQSVLYTAVLDVLLRVNSSGTELRTSNQLVRQLMEALNWILSWKSNDMIEAIDEQHDGLRWYERMLLNTFTDF